MNLAPFSPIPAYAPSIPVPPSISSLKKNHAISVLPGMGSFPAVPTIQVMNTGGPLVTQQGILPVTAGDRLTPQGPQPGWNSYQYSGKHSPSPNYSLWQANDRTGGCITLWDAVESLGGRATHPEVQEDPEETHLVDLEMDQEEDLEEADRLVGLMTLKNWVGLVVVVVGAVLEDLEDLEALETLAVPEDLCLPE